MNFPGPRIPELAQRDRFVKRAVKEGRVLTLADEQSACVASQRTPARTVQLFWSCPKEAKRWAKALTGEDALQEIPLIDFCADILPGLKSGKGLAGTDWVSDPIEPEVEPADLLLRLRMEAVGPYLGGILERGEVFMAEGEEGPQLLPLVRRGVDRQALYIFPVRAEGERLLKRVLPGKRVIADPVSDFISSTLPWLAERGHLVVLEPIPGAGPVELDAADLAARLDKLRRAA